MNSSVLLRKLHTNQISAWKNWWVKQRSLMKVLVTSRIYSPKKVFGFYINKVHRKRNLDVPGATMS